MGSLFFASISQISQSLRSRELSPVELLNSFLARVEKLQPKLNAFVHLHTAAARAQALAAESAILRGDSLGPLHGIPVTVKSCIAVSGLPNPAGSLLRKNEIPSTSAPLVQRLQNAGAILLGTTNTPEFLMAYEANNRLSGKTSNPWNLAHSSGGSSGGEAAAIAAGLSFGGIGSDGGGSIRVPAHFCGICGLKPTPGRVPSTGHYPEGNSAFGWLGVVGPMARTIADLRAIFNVVAVPDSSDPFSNHVPEISVSPNDLKNVRIGILESDAFGKPSPETSAAVSRAAKLLESRGFAVEPVSLPNASALLDLWWFFFGPVIAQLFEPLAKSHSHEFSPIFREYLEIASPKAPVTMEAFIAKCAQRDAQRAEVLRIMDRFPILLSPVSLSHAFRHGEGTWKSPSGYRETMRHSQWLNLAGLPGLSIPLSLSSQGLPIGVQLIGRPNEEHLLLAVGELLEESRGSWKSPDFA